MLNWVINFYLTPATDAYSFALNNRKMALFKKHLFLNLFIICSILSIISGLIFSLLSTFRLAKIWIFASGTNPTAEWQSQLLDNYVYISIIITTSVAFLTSLSGFFSFKVKYSRNRSLFRRLNFEIMQFDNKIGYYFNKEEKTRKSIFIDRISIILDLALRINQLLKKRELEDAKEKK